MKESGMLTLCSQYISEREREYRERRMRPRYHFSSPSGWMNDPHPPIWFRGEYHLFFNIYPFQAEGIRPKCWGHAVTRDFTSYRLLPCVLAPDQEYDRDGCASGCVVSTDEMLYAFYTGRNYYRLPREVQCMAVSSDGFRFEKPTENPILYPDTADRNDFRDPSVFRSGDGFIMLVGCREKEGPALAAYRSSDLYQWKEAGIFASGTRELGSMWECPSFLETDRGAYLIISPEKLDGMDQRCIYLSGSYDRENVRFTHTGRHELDHGADFYAAQFYSAPDGGTQLIAWMNRWKNRHFTGKEGWIGSITLPRRVRIGENGELIFSIPDEIKKLKGTEERFRNLCGSPEINLLPGKRSDCAWITILLDIEKLGNESVRFGALSDEDGTGGLSIIIGRETLFVSNETADHAEAEKRIKPQTTGGKLRLDILIDVSCVEICINEREFVTHCVGSGKDGIYLGISGKGEVEIDEVIIAEMNEARTEFMDFSTLTIG